LRACTRPSLPITSRREAFAATGVHKQTKAARTAVALAGLIRSDGTLGALVPRRFHAIAALIAVLVSAAGLAACGSSGGSGASAQQLLKDTFGANRPVRSGNLAVALNLNVGGFQGLKGPVALKLTGPFQSVAKNKLPKFDLSLSLAANGTNFTAGAISTGDKGFLKIQGTTYAVSGSLFQQFKQGYEQAAAKSRSQSGALSFRSLGVDPLRWLKNPKNEGSDTVGGTDTTHITADIDLAAFLGDINKLLSKAGALGQSANIPSGLTAQQRRDIQRSVNSAKFDLWTGKSDHTLRRVTIDLGVKVPADVQKRAGGLKTGRITFDLLISNLNKPQTIAAPTGARPLSDLTKALGGGASGATGTTTTPTTPPAATTTTPTTTGTSTTSSQYLDCLQKAGNDVAKVQKCAQLLGG
jgi:hypothetical protein